MPVLTDGFPTRFSGASLTIIGTQLLIKSVTPPGVMGGGPNDVTTMHNTAWRSKMPKKLKSLDSMTATVAYDPQAYSTIVNQMQVNQLITITFPDTHTVAFWGWLDGFKPNEVTEGNQPTATITVECSNLNSALVETAPVYT